MTRVVVAILSLLACLSQAVAGPDEDAVRKLLQGTFDKPGSPLAVDPVVVASDHAVAGWIQGEMGGCALLRRTGGEWVLVLCGGDALKSAAALAAAGVPKTAAAEIEKRLIEAEAQLDRRIVAQFSRFEGLVTMDEADHPPSRHQ